MSASNPPPPATRKTAADAIERLYVYWLASTALLLLALLALALMTRGALERSAAAQRELAARVANLEHDVRTLEFEPQPPRPHSPATRTAAPARPGRPPGEAGSDALEPLRPVETRPVAPAALQQVEIDAQLDALLPAGATLPTDIRDAESAAQLVELAQRTRTAPWTGANWARLALLAQLLGRDRPAEALAGRARSLKTAPLEYEAAAARSLLLRDRPQEALGHAEELARHPEAAPRAAVLVAAALVALDDLAGADEAAATIASTEDLSAIDWLILARVLVQLERWSELRALLREARDVPPALAAEYQFVTAASLAQEGRTVEALAILDGLLAEARPSATTSPSPLGWEPRRPARYEIELWRGITLIQAQQSEAARQALLQAAAVDPGRPEAHYYLGITEARAGRRAAAANHLKNALAASARMAPAWEALAVLELDGETAREIDRALEYLDKALDVNPRRATAHFLQALAHAKLFESTPAADALRRAFALDPTLLAEAEQSEVFMRLFTPAELEELAAGVAGEGAGTAEGAPGSLPDGGGE